MRKPSDRQNDGKSAPPSRRSRPRVEGLEERMLLYSTLNAQWTYGDRITYSFVPDGTSIGGTPSTLYQTLNASFPTAVWQREFDEAAAVWQAVARVNLVRVPDNGASLGVYGDQQGDARFGDIRISAIPLAYGTMGAAYSPPPANGGTLAGDVVLNSSMPWRIDAHYDLKTVAIHEIGHALGMDHTSISNAVMYAYYNAMKQSLNSDDVAGIRSIYQARRYDAWNSNGQSNAVYWDAKSLDGWRTPYNQITVNGLDMTTAGQTEWFWVTIPSSNIGSFTVSVQSSGLSLMTPQVAVFDASLGSKGSASTSGFGDTAVLTVPGVSTGQGFFIRASASGGGATGAFALQVNFGTSPLPAVAVPYTRVPYQAGGSGALNTMTGPTAPGHEDGHDSEHGHDHREVVQIGSLVAWGDDLISPEATRRAALAERATAARLAVQSARASFRVMAAAAEARASVAWATPRGETSTASGGMRRVPVTFDHAVAAWVEIVKPSGRRRPKPN